MSGYVNNKKEMRFQSVESLQSVVNVVNEAAIPAGVYDWQGSRLWLQKGWIYPGQGLFQPREHRLHG